MCRQGGSMVVGSSGVANDTTQLNAARDNSFVSALAVSPNAGGFPWWLVAMIGAGVWYVYGRKGV